MRDSTQNTIISNLLWYADLRLVDVASETADPKSTAVTETGAAMSKLSVPGRPAKQWSLVSTRGGLAVDP